MTDERDFNTAYSLHLDHFMQRIRRPKRGLTPSEDWQPPYGRRHREAVEEEAQDAREAEMERREVASDWKEGVEP